eukprot:tig00000180_g13644.t1
MHFSYNLQRCSATADDPTNPGTLLAAVTDQATIRLIGAPETSPAGRGTCTLETIVGLYPETRYKVTCSGWSAPFNVEKALPLTYSLKALQLKDKVLVAPSTTAEMITADVPLGTHTLVATICSPNECGCSEFALPPVVVKAIFNVKVQVEVFPPPGTSESVCYKQTYVARCLSSAIGYPNYQNLAIQRWSAPNGEPILANLNTSPYFNASSKVNDSLTFTPELRPAFEYNKIYKLKCYATAPDPEDPSVELPSVADEATVQLIGPPASQNPGTCAISPTEGTFIATTFTVSCPGWTPPFNLGKALPLTYSLSPSEILVRPQLNSVMTVPPIQVGEHTVTAVICSNNTCGCSEVPMKVTIKQPDDPCTTYSSTMAVISAQFAAGTITEQRKTIMEAEAIEALSRHYVGLGQPPCLNTLIDNACSAGSAAQRLQNLAKNTGDIGKAFPELEAMLKAINTLANVSSSFVNSTLFEKLTRCKPEFDPCDFLNLDLSVYLEQTTQELSAAIASPDWVGTAGTGLTGQAEASSSPLANLLNTLIKGPQGRLAKCAYSSRHDLAIACSNTGLRH